MDSDNFDSHFCCKHKLRIWGSIIGTILVAGVIGSVVVVVTYATTTDDKSCGANILCLNLTRTKSCLATDSSPYRHYGTKTNYNISKEDILESAKVAVTTGCKPVFFYLLSRHAIRYPDKETIEEMQLVLPDLQALIINSNTSLCDQDLENLKEWRLEMKPEDDNHVPTSGSKQAENIAVRFKEKFPTLLNGTFYDTIYEFGITSKIRTRETAEGFAKGLFGNDISEINYPVNDTILHFNQKCKKLLKKKGYVDEDHEEVLKFRNGTIMSLTIKDISTRLGFNVTFDEAILMYSVCAFNYVINLDNSSPWCSVFSASNIEVFEYLHDLDDYYGDAYGNPRNYRQACPLIQDMVEQLRTAKDDQSASRKALLYFSHSGVTKKVFAHLGLYRDSVPLKANEMCCRQDRQWRSSIISPFNANIAMVLYNCAGKFKVETYLQETPHVIDGCKTTLCNWEDFEKHYSATSENCKLKKICVP